MVVRDKTAESLTEYKLDKGTRVDMEELYSDIDYNELVSDVLDIGDMSLFDYALSLEGMSLETELVTFVDVLRGILNIEEIDGYVALLIVFRAVDLNILKNMSLDEFLNSRVTRQEYWSIINRVLNIENKNNFTDEKDKLGAITVVESAYYVLQEFEGYVENSEVVSMLCLLYGLDMKESDYIARLSSEEDIEMSVEEYISGSISAYNSSVLFQGEKIIYPYIKTMSEIIQQELILEDEVTYELEKDLLREVTYRDLFYMIYKFLTYEPAE